ncbi:Cytochrome P450 6B1, partial [Habropoda laboriosa]
FWKVRGVPGPKPVPVFGNIKDAMLLRTALSNILRDLYQEYKDEPMIGIFTRRTPALIIRDPELIKDVLIRDFSKFSDRGIPFDEKVNVGARKTMLSLTRLPQLTD